MERREVDPRVILPLCLAAFIGVTNVMAPAPFLDELAGDLDTSVPLVGQAVSITLLTAAFVGMVAGPLADHSGHRRVLLVGLVFAGLSAVGSALAPSYALFMAARALGGFGSSITIGVAFGAAAALFAGRARRRAVSLVGASLSLGTALGPPTLTTISIAGGWRGAFTAIGAFAALGFVAMLLLFPADEPHGNGRFDLGRLLDSYRPLVRQRAMAVLYGAWTLRSVCWIGSFAFLGAFFSEQHDYSTRTVGLVYLLGGGGFMLGTLAAGGRLGAFNLRLLSALTLVTMGLGWAALFTLPLAPPVALGVLVATTFVGGVVMVGVMTLIADRSPAGPSTTMVLTETVLSLGAALGGGMGGLLLGSGGFIALGIGLSLAALAGAALIARRETPSSVTGQVQPT